MTGIRAFHEETPSKAYKASSLGEPSMPHRNVDEYIASFPEEVQKRLQRMRETIRKAAPGATEAMSHGVPAFKLNGNLVLLAASARVAFAELPLHLIGQI
jgi:hypothetical protein